MKETILKEPIPVNPAILRWARELNKLDIPTIARKMNIPVGKITEWENPESPISPTVVQARKLAGKYSRPFLELFFDKVPDLPKLKKLPDYRLYKDYDHPLDSRSFEELHLEAITQRLDALDLYDELNEKSTEFPEVLYSSCNDDVEEKATLARKVLNFNFSEQISLNNKNELLRFFREKIESKGILTLKLGELTNHKIRGFCIAEFPLPVVVFGKESKHAQIFTIMHEFAHIILKKSGVISKMTRTGGNEGIRTIEKWCNSFSAAFLMPKLEVEKLITKPGNPKQSIDDDQLVKLSKKFSVSKHAMLIRLVNLGYVEANFYWAVKRAEFEKEDAEYKGFGKASYWAVRCVNKYGNLYTSLVLRAWSDNRITKHKASEYMGLVGGKIFEHINDIRDNFTW